MKPFCSCQSMRSILALTVCLPAVYAHGYVFWPMTRSDLFYPGPPTPPLGNYIDVQGNPIIGTTLPILGRRDPMTLPPIPLAQQASLAPGALTIFWGWGDGANHIGPCLATLGSRSNSSMNITIGMQDNCAQDLYFSDSFTIGKGTTLTTPSYFVVTLPTGYTQYTDLFIWVQLTAHHLHNDYGGWEQFRDVIDFQWSATANNSVPPSVVQLVIKGWAGSQFESGLRMSLLPSGTPGVSASIPQMSASASTSASASASAPASASTGPSGTGSAQQPSSSQLCFRQLPKDIFAL